MWEGEKARNKENDGLFASTVESTQKTLEYFFDFCFTAIVAGMNFIPITPKIRK